MTENTPKEAEEISMLEENEVNDLYNYCPLCGEEWTDNPESHTCSLSALVDRKKPRFYIIDINNYNEEFLKEMILWQDLKIRSLTKPESVNAGELGLKDMFKVRK